MLITLLIAAAIFLAYFNGANDNFKGVATLYGSGIVNYKKAITLATIATFAGSVTAILIAQGLIASFSGKGLVPTDVAGATDFLIAVGIGAGATVLLATRFGFPISTTHSLVGGLVGAGLMAVGLDINFARLGGAFFAPLLVSPFLAFALCAVLYTVFKKTRKTLGVTKETCIYFGEQKDFVPLSALPDSNQHAFSENMVISNPVNARVAVAKQGDCAEFYTGRVWGISLQWLLDTAHIISAAAVSFARGLNDTPKIAGLLVAAEALDVHWGMLAIGVGMGIGGLLNARRVAETMSKRITEINPGQGFTANLVTSILVIIASKFGIPVSTTHVSVGAIFGIGMVNKKRNTKVIKSILMSWLITLPVAAILSALVYWMLSV